MDTADLSSEAYNGIIFEAKKFNHDLTLQLGLKAYCFINERKIYGAVNYIYKRISKFFRTF